MTNDKPSPLEALMRLPHEARLRVFEAMEANPELQELNHASLRAFLAGNVDRGNDLAERACRRWYPIILAASPEAAKQFDLFDSSNN